MKKTIFKKISVAIAIASLMFVASCTNEDYSLLNFDQEEMNDAQIRSTTTYIIDFEGLNRSYMADTTSYGENLYAAYTGTQIVPYVHPATGLKFAIHGAGGSSPVNFWDGGFVISDWNYKSNIPGKSGDWWYSYLNQCSVYSGTDGANDGGYNESSNFALMFGYVDSYNSTYAAYPTLEFTSGSGVIDGMYICLSSYTYGVIEYGNTFGSIGEATPLEDIDGYFKLLAYGYNATTPTNGGDPVEIYLANYSLDENDGIIKDPITIWEYFDLSSLGTVTHVEFNLEGSDSGAYGLNTPAYVCMDNISVTK